VPESAGKECNLRRFALGSADRGFHGFPVLAGFSHQLEPFWSTPENRGVPGSSPGGESPHTPSRAGLLQLALFHRAEAAYPWSVRHVQGRMQLGDYFLAVKERPHVVGVSMEAFTG